MIHERVSSQGKVGNCVTAMSSGKALCGGKPPISDSAATCCRSLSTPNVGRLLRAMIAAEPCRTTTGSTPHRAIEEAAAYAAADVRSQAPVLCLSPAAGLGNTAATESGLPHTRKGPLQAALYSAVQAVIKWRSVQLYDCQTALATCTVQMSQPRGPMMQLQRGTTNSLTSPGSPCNVSFQPLLQVDSLTTTSRKMTLGDLEIQHVILYAGQMPITMGDTTYEALRNVFAGAPLLQACKDYIKLCCQYLTPQMLCRVTQDLIKLHLLARACE